MTDFIKGSLPNLSVESLISLVKDAEYRIGSYVAAGDANDPYVNKQREIISLVQEEFIRRK